MLTYLTSTGTLAAASAGSPQLLPDSDPFGLQLLCFIHSDIWNVQAVLYYQLEHLSSVSTHSYINHIVLLMKQK